MYIYTYILYFSMSNALVRKIFVKMPFHQPSCESISSPLRHRHIRQVTSTSGYWLDLLFGSDGVAAEAACLQRGMSSSWETSVSQEVASNMKIYEATSSHTLHALLWSYTCHGSIYLRPHRFWAPDCLENLWKWNRAGKHECSMNVQKSPIGLQGFAPITAITKSC